MRNWLSGLCAAALLCSLCGCGSVSGGSQAPMDSSSTIAAPASSTSISQLDTLSRELTATGIHCATDTGYYYLAEDWKELKDGHVGMALLYVDYASRQEVYLCSDSSCSHDTDRCSAIFSDAEFILGSSALFVYQDKLYLLSKESDNDNSYSTQQTSGDIVDFLADPRPAALYRMNLDGTNREKVYAFDPALTVEDWVFGDPSGLYFITKKLDTRQSGSTQFVSSTDRQVMHLDLDKAALESVQPLNLDDKTSWTVLGCAGSRLILSGVVYQKELTDQEALDNDTWKAAYLDSTTRYMALDLNTGAQQQLAELSNQNLTSDLVADGYLYLSQPTDQNITRYDPATGEKKVVAKLKQNNLLSTLGGKLCCRDWDLSKDFTYYFVDPSTGKVQHSKLVNKRLGWDLEFLAENDRDALVIYDYEATPGTGKGLYNISQYKLALIDKNDLFQGVDRFQPIQMTGKGR